MNRLPIVFLWIACRLSFALFFEVPAFAEGPGRVSPFLTVLYTGNTLEEIKPCGCSRQADFGGLLRRGTVIRGTRERKPEVLVLDAGDSLKGKNAQGRLKAGLLAGSFSLLGYDAMLPGEKDFLYGPEFFHTGDFQGWVASNLSGHGAGFKKIIIKEYPGGLRAGIMGVIDDTLFPDAAHPGISVIPPREFLRTRLSSLIRENRVDLPILLAHVPEETARGIFREFRDIKIIVAGHTEDPDSEDPVNPVLENGRGLFFADNRGRRVGEIRVPRGGEGRLSHRWIPLDKAIPDDPRLTPLFGKYKKRVRDLFLKTTQRQEKSRKLRAFVSAGQCVPCHRDAGKAWEKTRHAGALETLKSARRSFDPECLPCHVAGYNHGGFISEEITPDLGGVQCEACHGPGRDHVSDSSSKYGKATRAVCLKCHTRARDPRFSFEDSWKKIEH